MTIRVIVACDSTYGIGYKGTIPWGANKEDLRWFKKNTLGSVVIMGKNTWEDPKMPKPLIGRTNVVVSKSSITEGFDTKLTNYNLEPYVRIMKSRGINIYLIGGATLIRNNLHIVDEVLINILPSVYNCDTFLPMEEINMDFYLQQEFTNTKIHTLRYIRK